MPNLELRCGKKNKGIRKKIDTLMMEAGLGKKTITTIISTAETKSCGSNKAMPYVIVWTNDEVDLAYRIAERINLELNLDVEVREIKRFFAGR